MTTNRDSGLSGELTGSQLKALLKLAMQGASPAASPEARDPQVVNAQSALDELGASCDETTGAVLERIERHALVLDELRAAKEMAKRLLPQAVTSSQKDAVTLLYHAAIASALVGHGEHISTQPLDAHKRIYEELSGTLRGPLGDIFRRASLAEI